MNGDDHPVSDIERKLMSEFRYLTLRNENLVEDIEMLRAELLSLQVRVTEIREDIAVEDRLERRLRQLVSE
ncbi:MAG: hypothetical protein M1302_04070 [Candidatus Thermoplasmatota archaeon]|nr:hypothetical protein [Candidatus Thermoplasmatota archaeon]